MVCLENPSGFFSVGLLHVGLLRRWALLNGVSRGPGSVMLGSLL